MGRLAPTTPAAQRSGEFSAQLGATNTELRNRGIPLADGGSGHGTNLDRPTPRLITVRGRGIPFTDCHRGRVAGRLGLTLRLVAVPNRVIPLLDRSSANCSRLALQLDEGSHRPLASPDS